MQPLQVLRAVVAVLWLMALGLLVIRSRAERRWIRAVCRGGVSRVGMCFTSRAQSWGSGAGGSGSSRSSRRREATNGGMFCTFGFDNNANVHYTGDKSLLSDFRRVYGISVEGLGGEVDVSGIGSLHCQCKTSNGGMLEFVLRVEVRLPSRSYRRERNRR